MKETKAMLYKTPAKKVICEIMEETEVKAYPGLFL